jgi:hypothetical protein
MEAVERGVAVDRGGDETHPPVPVVVKQVDDEPVGMARDGVVPVAAGGTVGGWVVGNEHHGTFGVDTPYVLGDQNPFGGRHRGW